MRRFIVFLIFVLSVGSVLGQSIIKQPMVIDVNEKGLGEFKVMNSSDVWHFKRRQGDKIDVYEFTLVKGGLMPPAMQRIQTLTVKEFDEFILKDYNDNFRNPKLLNIGRMHADNMVFKKLYLKVVSSGKAKYYEVTFSHSTAIVCYG
ncbi:hypothetical protein LNQ81_07655 [Myroides sp. M-43]|uniref:hypothetical protein n=1 Tax=Myroides oncorhynchi TaxID=2893756 RepID=UPI001E2F66F7|nr:hypothetical protein [Myroides oncorhynchi]MCC9042563.1 hypothetical protein [Myroides oncorhynchi]